MGKMSTTDDYRPNDQEPYMNPRQLTYFKQVLTEWRRKLQRKERGLKAVLQCEKTVFADPLDRGIQAAAQDLDLTSKLRNQQLLKQINEALVRIDNGNYGYCLESGEEIGLQRLEILPFATLSVGCQEHIERTRHLHYKSARHSSATESVRW